MNKSLALKKIPRTLSALQPCAAAVWLALMPLSTLAAGAAQPDAGSLLQQLQTPLPALPAATDTGLTIARPDSASLPASAPFLVQSIEISGNTLFETPRLLALVADARGQSLDLPRLGALAARITAFYQQQGYPLARAIVPAQTIAQGVVHLQVIEARYGQVRLDNRSAVAPALLQDTLAPLQAGQPIAQAGMDHALLLLSDLAGVLVSATLRPGDAVGSADLLVSTSSGSATSGSLLLDGYGSRYTGRERLGATFTVSNPLHYGDSLTGALLSSGSGLNYGRLGYESPVNGQGTRLGAAWSALGYRLGDSLAPLQASGDAQVGSLWVKQSLLRQRDASVWVQLQYDKLRLRDHVEASVLHTDRSLENGSLTLSGDFRDGWLSGGLSGWSLGVTAGHTGFDDPAAQAADAASAATRGNFYRWNGGLSRLQALGAVDALYLSFSGQWAGGNLDASQKTSMGGPFNVRAYDTGAVSGDSGTFVSAEYRRALGAVGAGQMQFIAFVDSASVTINQKPWAGGSNSASLSGAGLGLKWSGPGQWTAAASVATPLGPVPAQVGATESTRAWLEIGKQF